MKKILALFLLLTGLLLNCSEKSSEKTVPMAVENVKVLEVPAVQKMTAAFMKITNNTSDEDYLIGAESDAAEVCEIHEMIMEGEIMRMQKLDSVEIPAGKSIELKNGGIHLMLINLKREIKSGDSVKIKLKFKNSNEIDVTGTAHPFDHMH